MPSKTQKKISRADDGRHKIINYRNIPKYLSSEKEKTPKIGDLLNKFFKKDITYSMIYEEDADAPSTLHSATTWAFNLLWKDS